MSFRVRVSVLELLLLKSQVHGKGNPSWDLFALRWITLLVEVYEDSRAVETYLGVPCILLKYF